MNSPLLMIAPAAIGLCCGAALVAFRFRNRGAYMVAKMLASAGFVTLAFLGGATHSAWSAVVFGGLVIAATGDGAMAFSGKKGFLVGLACFAVAYCAYSVAFLLHGAGASVVLIPALALAGSAAVGAWRYLYPHLPKRIHVFVIIYFAVMTVMLGTGVASARTNSNGALLVGVALVATSDVAVARERFLSPSFVNKLIGLTMYYAGQTLIALGVGVLAT